MSRGKRNRISIIWGDLRGLADQSAMAAINRALRFTRKDRDPRNHGRRFSLLQGKRDRKGCTFSLLTFHGDIASIMFDNFVCDVEPHTQAGESFLARTIGTAIEAFKDSVTIRLRDTNA